MDMKDNETSLALRSVAEELAAAITHGVGLFLALAGIAYLSLVISSNFNFPRLLAFLVYSTSIFLLYLSSTIYHSKKSVESKLFWRKIDYFCIYILIAGTYTPFFLLALSPSWAIPLLGIVWGFGFAGSFITFFQVPYWKIIAVSLYLTLGWIGLVAARPLFISLEGEIIAWILAGGIIYTVGVLFYAWDNLSFNHSIWHCFVLVASFCHWMAVAGILEA